MKITLICVGKVKEKFLKDGISEYAKRISKFASLDIIEVSDIKAPENLSDKDMLNIKIAEGNKILEKIKPNSYIVSLEINGKNFSSEEFSKFIENKSISGIGHIYFVIGGSLGLSDDVVKKSDFKLSFSKMTFPHQLMRLILLEQIYRGFKIIKNEPYHK